MKLFYYRSNIPNFGDDLNEWLWPKVFPNLFNEDFSCLFVGIGTILDDRIPKEAFKIVFGSGVRNPARPPKIDAKWDIRALRGKLSARVLNVDEKVAITDPGILVKLFFQANHQKTYNISYMPYFRSASKEWEIICKRLGIKYIDPRKSVEACLLDISRSKFLFSEAMHGAIIADALRVPWIPVRSFNVVHEDEVHSFKWIDWCSSLKIEFKPINLPVLWSNVFSFKGRAKKFLKMALIFLKLTYFKRQSDFVLSNDVIFQETIERYLEAIDLFKRDYNLN